MSFALHVRLLYAAIAVSQRYRREAKLIGQCISRGERLSYVQLLGML